MVSADRREFKAGHFLPVPERGGVEFRRMKRDDRIRITDTEARRLRGASTKVYFRSVIQKIFPKPQREEHLEKLLGGDRETLDACARHLSKNLDFFPLLHTLCLVTGQRFDLQVKDPAKAADAWLCWFGENRDRLVWDPKQELWRPEGGKTAT